MIMPFDVDHVLRKYLLNKKPLLKKIQFFDSTYFSIGYVILHHNSLMPIQNVLIVIEQ